MSSRGPVDLSVPRAGGNNEATPGFLPASGCRLPMPGRLDPFAVRAGTGPQGPWGGAVSVRP